MIDYISMNYAIIIVNQYSISSEKNNKLPVFYSYILILWNCYINYLSISSNFDSIASY
jgi:hypothetical protein